jgi:hypothetical protein
LKHTQNVESWYPKGAKFELIGYSDSDYAGCKVERRSTSGTCQLLGRSLVFWLSKKQNSVALSTTKAKYIATGSCCAQILRTKATLNDFEIKFKQVSLLCDNESVVNLTNNRFNMQEQSTYMSAIISLDHQQKGIFQLRMWAPMINLPKSSPSHLMRKGFASYEMN